MTTDSTTTQTHWVIVSDEGTSTKPKKHTTYQSARDESIRLSKLKPGINFAVYQMIGTAFTEKPAEPPTSFTAYKPKPVPYSPHEYQNIFGIKYGGKSDDDFWPRQWY